MIVVQGPESRKPAAHQAGKRLPGAICLR